MSRKRKKAKKSALITGITGQDGSYLAELLLSKGYGVSGIVTKNDPLRYRNISSIKKKLDLYSGDLRDLDSLARVIKKVQPSEVYNLGYAGPPVKSFMMPEITTEVTALGALRLFMAVKDNYPRARVFQASSSTIFGGKSKLPQNEDTKAAPTSIYGASKLFADNSARIFRQHFNIFIASGISFNHTSPRGSLEFIVPKVAYSAACAKLGIKTSKELNELQEPIVKNGKVKLGNLEVKRDFGFAGDFVKAMWLMLQQDRPDDYVIGTGKAYSMKDVCKAAYSYVGLDWQNYVSSDKRLLRQDDIDISVADITKAKKVLGWKPKVKFNKLVEMLVDANVARLK